MGEYDLMQKGLDKFSNYEPESIYGIIRLTRNERRPAGAPRRVFRTRGIANSK